jgi:phage recombination protein Bet
MTLATRANDTSNTAQFNPEQIELIKNNIAKGATNEELALFLGVCNRTGLDPFARQIFCVERWGQGGKQMVTQISVDGQRLIAERTGKYEGQTLEYWCGPDGIWRDVWLEETPPAAAKVGVYKSGCREPIWAIATFAEYAGKKKDGTLIVMWAKMPARMLLKCAEALALRKAFPQELSGIYTVEEMAQSGSEVEVIEPGIRASQELRAPVNQRQNRVSSTPITPDEAQAVNLENIPGLDKGTAKIAPLTDAEKSAMTILKTVMTDDFGFTDEDFNAFCSWLTGLDIWRGAPSVRVILKAFMTSDEPNHAAIEERLEAWRAEVGESA